MRLKVVAKWSVLERGTVEPDWVPDWVPDCGTGLGASLGSTFSFDLCIIGQQDVPNYSVCVCVCVCVSVCVL